MSKTSIRWVIKLGGSLSQSHHLGTLLASLAKCPCLIVPGGGPFADGVRETQKQQGFHDALAHDLAIRAMALYGQMLLGMEPRLHPVVTFKDWPENVVPRQPYLWLPDPDEPSLQSLDPSWDVTSDSIAAHLALELNIPELLLIKSVEPKEREIKLQSPTGQALIDPAFGRIVQGRPLKLWVMGPNPQGLAKGFENPLSSFTQLIA